MNLQEFKIYSIKEKLGLANEKFGKVFVFIDFSNVNKWFANDNRDWDGNILDNGKKLGMDIEKLYDFTKCFSDHTRFYYGYDPQNINSVKFLGKTKYVFGDKMVFAKPIQQIRHYLNDDNGCNTNTRKINHDRDGNYIFLPKCNFDVEICVDAIRLMSKYETFCIFSGDADFISLIKFLKKNRKKVILFKGGYIQYALKANSDLVVSVQDIKVHITKIKQKSS